VLNRLTATDYSDSTPDVHFCYDGKTSNGSGCTGSASTPNKGLLTGVGSSVSRASYTYDTVGRVLTSSQTTESNTYPFTYAYLEGDNLASFEYPSGFVVDYTYDDAGRSLSLSGTPDGGSAANYATSMTYAPHGALEQVTLGNGRWETWDFNGRLQPTAIALGSTQGGSELLGLALTYGSSNNNGNLVSQTITMPKDPSGTLVLTQSYGYDGVNRLASAGEVVTSGGAGGGNWSIGHGYDRYGNMWVSSISGLSPHMATPLQQSQISASTNRLTGTNITYDTAGNLPNHPYIGAMQYDAENRQKQFTGGSTTTYAYDGEGRRVNKVQGSDTIVYVYDAFGNLAAEYSTKEPSADGGRRYRTTDHLGSTRRRSMEDLRLLERLAREEEDRLDLEAALAEPGENIPLKRLKKELALCLSDDLHGRRQTVRGHRRPAGILGWGSNLQRNKS